MFGDLDESPYFHHTHNFYMDFASYSPSRISRQVGKLKEMMAWYFEDLKGNPVKWDMVRPIEWDVWENFNKSYLIVKGNLLGRYRDWYLEELKSELAMTRQWIETLVIEGNDWI